MLPDATQTFHHFAHFGLTLERRTAGLSNRSSDGWSLRMGGHRVFRIDGKADFPTLEALWTFWYREQSTLERAYRCARAVAEGALEWTADERYRMERWLYEHRYGRQTLTYVSPFPDRNCWPWTMMQSDGPLSRLTVCGGPWVDDPEPGRVPLESVCRAALEEPAWRARALEVGRFDLQHAGLFAAALAGLVDDAERLALDTRLAKAVAIRSVVSGRARL